METAGKCKPVETAFADAEFIIIKHDIYNKI